MTGPSRILFGLLLLTTACVGASGGDSTTAMPPEAFGTFEDRNDPTFNRVLLVEAQRVVLTTTVMVGGRATGSPSECASAEGISVTPEMSLSLTCSGEQIAYSLTYRADQQDWIVVEEQSAPMIFTRTGAAPTAITPTAADSLPPDWANDDGLPIWAGYFREAGSALVDNEQDPVALCTDLVLASGGTEAASPDTSPSPPTGGGNCMAPVAEAPVTLTMAADGAYRLAWTFDEPADRRGVCTGTLETMPTARNPDLQIYFGDRYTSTAQCTVFDVAGGMSGPNATSRTEQVVMHFEYDSTRSVLHAEWSVDLPGMSLETGDLYRMPVTARQKQQESEARTRYFAQKEPKPASGYRARRYPKLREAGAVPVPTAAPQNTAPATPVSELVKSQCALEVDENAYAFLSGGGVDLDAWRRTTNDRINMAYIRCIRERR
jgi:hypothetical protein